MTIEDFLFYRLKQSRRIRPIERIGGGSPQKKEEVSMNVSNESSCIASMLVRRLVDLPFDQTLLCVSLFHSEDVVQWDSLVGGIFSRLDLCDAARVFPEPPTLSVR